MADQVVDVVGKVVAAGAISANAHGNVSLRVPLGDEMYFTGRRSFATAHLRWWLASASTGSFARDSFPPSRAPCVAMHAAIYALRPDVGSMIHAHSPFATASQDGVPHHSGGLHPEHPLGITCYNPCAEDFPSVIYRRSRHLHWLRSRTRSDQGPRPIGPIRTQQSGRPKAAPRARKDPDHLTGEQCTIDGPDGKIGGTRTIDEDGEPETDGS